MQHAAIPLLGLLLTACATAPQSQAPTQQATPTTPTPYTSTYKAAASGPTLIRGATLLTGTGTRIDGGDVLLVDGWMTWHHLAGLIGGLFVLTWIFSGWLSMGSPVPWNGELDVDRMIAGNAAFVGNDQPRFTAPLSVLNSLSTRDVSQASFVWSLGRPVLLLKSRDGRVDTVDPTTGTSFSLDEPSLIAAAPSLLRNARLVETQLLEQATAPPGTPSCGSSASPASSSLSAASSSTGAASGCRRTPRLGLSANCLLQFGQMADGRYLHE